MKKLFIASALVLFVAIGVAGCQGNRNTQPMQEEANREKAVYCMDLMENQHDLDTARHECFSDTYIQHSPYIEDGVEAVLNVFANRFERYPDFSIEIKRTSAEGDLVWMHLHAKLTPDDRGIAGMHIFRMKNGKFVEHWGVGQAVPETSMNDNTMF